MACNHSENVPQNLIDNGACHSIAQNYLHPHPSAFKIPIPIYAVPPPLPFYPGQFFSMDKPQMFRVKHHVINDQNVNSPGMRVARKPSPMKSPPIPFKRHRMNETPKSNHSNGSNVSNNEGANNFEVDNLFYELQSLFSDGCSFTENVARGYRKRPCFKKIELLLSRLRLELNVHHNILSNINSQGTAWAIKDFIFVFSRIVNAWIIMRGYIYDKSEGLQSLHETYDPKFVDNFIEWEEATLKMMKTLMGTVENLDVLTQNKSGNLQKKKEVYLNTDVEVKEHDKEFLEEFQKNLFLPKFLENSAEVQYNSQKNRSYFSAGYLKPLQIDNSCSPSSTYNSSCYPFSSPSTPATPITPITPDNDDPLNWVSYEDLNDAYNFSSSSSSSERLYNRKSIGSLPATPIEQLQNPLDTIHEKSRAKKDLSTKFKSMDLYNNDIEAELEKEFGSLEMI